MGKYTNGVTGRHCSECGEPFLKDETIRHSICPACEKRLKEEHKDTAPVITVNCPDCDEIPNAPMAISYLKLFNRCWDCDKHDWERGQMPLKDFEKREQQALDDACKT